MFHYFRLSSGENVSGMKVVMKKRLLNHGSVKMKAISILFDRGWRSVDLTRQELVASRVGSEITTFLLALAMIDFPCCENNARFPP